MQWVTPDIGDAFRRVDTALWDTFLTALFQGVENVTPCQGVASLPLIQAGMDHPYLTKTAPEKWTESCVITVYLIAELRGQD